MIKIVTRNCWCQKGELLPFSKDYAICSACKTLVAQTGLSDEQLLVKNDDKDFYGKNYWLTHVSDDFNQPDIYNRVRNDLSERCLHWIETLLKYKLPQARVLELGCAHGGFVAMMRTLNYDAIGLELSPWIVDFARNSFDIPVVLGTMEEQQFPPESFDVIALMDVLEHLPNPKETIKTCLAALKLDGILLIQTPEYLENLTYDDLKKQNHMFLLQMKTDEHLYLFNQDSVQSFFKELGVSHFAFEPAIFYQYDMFFVASRVPLQSNSVEAIEKVLCSSTQGRIILSMLETRKHIQTIEEDRANRLVSIETLTTLVHQAEKDQMILVKAQKEHLSQIEQLTKQYKQSEKDRLQLEQDRKAHLNQIEQFKQSEKDRLQVEQDRKAHLSQIEQLTKRCQSAEKENVALKQDRTSHLEQITWLTKQLEISEKDRAERLRVIEALSEQVK